MVTRAQSLHVTLPPKLHKHVSQQVKEEGYSTKSDYIQSLIRKEIKLKEQKKLERMLLEGLASGIEEYSEKQWKDLKKDVVNSVKKSS